MTRPTDKIKFCKHGGYIHPDRTCAKLHDVRALVGGSTAGWFCRMPCVISDRSRHVAACPDQALVPKEEHFAEVIELDKQIHGD